MTPLQQILASLGWSHRHAGTRIGVSASTVRHWCAGANTRGNPCQPPEDAFRYFRACLAAVERVPAPEKKNDGVRNTR